MADDASAFEKHYSIGDLSKMWSIGRETLRKVFLCEPGVVRIRMGRASKHTHYSIPESVARRVHLRLQNNGK
jgi:hypothetical protein